MDGLQAAFSFGDCIFRAYYACLSKTVKTKYNYLIERLGAYYSTVCRRYIAWILTSKHAPAAVPNVPPGNTKKDYWSAGRLSTNQGSLRKVLKRGDQIGVGERGTYNHEVAHQNWKSYKKYRSFILMLQWISTFLELPGAQGDQTEWASWQTLNLLCSHGAMVSFYAMLL